MLGCNESNIIFQQHLCKLGQLRRKFTSIRSSSAGFYTHKKHFRGWWQHKESFTHEGFPLYTPTKLRQSLSVLLHIIFLLFICYSTEYCTIHLIEPLQSAVHTPYRTPAQSTVHTPYRTPAECSTYTYRTPAECSTYTYRTPAECSTYTL